MAEIPYFFETPVPKYFRENGWFDCEHMFKFVTWAFSKCQTIPHKMTMEGKELLLAPYEFIAGRLSSPKECFLTENIFRHQLVNLEKSGLIKKTTNSLRNHYSCYVWITEVFSKQKNNQPNNQPNRGRKPKTDQPNNQPIQQTNSMKNNQPNNQPNRGKQPTIDQPNNHKLRKSLKKKEDHPSIPSFANAQSGRDETDDFPKIDMGFGVLLTKQELASCIKLKGSAESVAEAISFIQGSKRRKHEITDWPHALATWKVEKKVRIEENVAYAERLCALFENFQDGRGWRCRLIQDRRRDQRGVLFEGQTGYQEGFFVALVDGEFQKKCENFIKDKNMKEKH